VHHGALGSYATVYLPAEVDGRALAARIAALRGIDTVLTRAEAASRFELPATGSAIWWWFRAVQ